MIRTAIVSIVLLLTVISPILGGNVYYVSQSGNDYNNGMSWSQAWKSVQKVNNTIVAGDTVFFGTGRWLNSQIRPPQGGDVNHQTLYACSTFTVDTKYRAKIYGGEIVSGWSYTGGGIWRLSWTGDDCYEYGCGSLVQDEEPLQLIDPNYTSLTSGRYYYSNGYIYVRCFNDADPNDHEMIASCKPPVYFYKYNPDIAYVKIWGLDLRYGQQGTVYFNARTNHISIEHCNIGSSGHTSANAAGVFASANDGGKSAPDTSTFGHYNTIRACNIGNIRSLLCSWARLGTGDGLIIYSEKYFTVDSCFIYGPVGTGVNFKGFGNGSHMPFNVARFNTIVDAGRHGIDIWVHPYKDSIYGNSIIEPASHGIFIHSSSEPWLGDIVIYNNSIFDPGDHGIEIWEDTDIGHCGDGLEIKYNVIHSPYAGITFSYWSNNSCQNACVIDSNMYYNVAHGWSSSCGNTWSAWQSCGFDVHGMNGTDPDFADPYNYDLSRPGAPVQMSRADYGERLWKVWGAVQPAGGCDPPSMPIYLSPPNGASDVSQPIPFNWENVSTATKYQLQVDNASNFGSPEVNLQTTPSQYNVSGLLGGSTYYWRVRAYNDCGGWGAWSTTRYLTTSGSCDPPGLVTLQTPSYGATGVGIPTYFNWSTATGATKYRIQVDNSSSFSSPEIDAQPSASDYTVYSGLSEDVTYYWRVAGYNACGWGDWSSTSYFTTSGGCTPPGQVTLLSPSSGSTNVQSPVTFDWNATFGTTKYRIQVDNSSTFATPEVDVQPTASEYTVSGGFVEGVTYYWRVAGYNPCGWGSWSSVWNFVSGGGGGPGDDVTPPTISEVRAGDTTATTARAYWHTNEPANSKVIYYSGMFGTDSTDLDPAMLPSHNVLITGLFPNTIYTYQVVSADAAGNTSQSPFYSFKTAGIILDAEDEGMFSAVGRSLYKSSQPTFVVTNAGENDLNKYYFEVATDSLFVNMVATSYGVDQQDGEHTEWKSNRVLQPDQKYFWRASLNHDSYSKTTEFEVAPKPHVYPNPFEIDKAPQVVFTDVPPGSTLILTTVAGETVKRWANTTGDDIVWDGITDYGNKVAPGVYLWFVEDSDVSGKLMVTK